MFDCSIQTCEENRVLRYGISCEGVELAYSTVVNLWQTDPLFRDYFTSLLAESAFAGFRWETPPLTGELANRPFEFVLVNSPGLASRSTDRQPFLEHFTESETEEGVVSFANLRNDATMIVPSPRGADDHYGHLAAFVRGAPRSQVHALWRVLGKTIAANLSRKPVWISTAGGGVAWLHVRLDTRPKYYSHAPYKIA
ncbi:MAG: hypothetical protein KDA78_04980 [Planctomycetaceae bacterium]|nr:hypothetical protein [Planctomycetaceae bacterium]